MTRQQLPKFLDAALKRHTQAPPRRRGRGRPRADAPAPPAAARRRVPLWRMPARAARLAIRAGLAARRRARLLRRARLHHRHRRARPPLRCAGCAVRGRQPRRSRLDRVRARSADRSTAMSIAQFAPAMTRGSSRWLLLGSLALNLFFIGVALAMAIRAPARAGLGPRRVRARRAHRRHPAAGRCRPAARPDQRQPSAHRGRADAIPHRAGRRSARRCGRSRSTSRPCARPWPRPARRGRLSTRPSRACSRSRRRKCRRPAATRWPTGRRAEKPRAASHRSG